MRSSLVEGGVIIREVAGGVTEEVNAGVLEGEIMM